jgi:tetratricopeptide (TPR) repeat protein
MSICRLIAFCTPLLLPLAAHAQSPQDLHMACLLTQIPDERIDACTVAIEKAGLSTALLSDAYSIRGVMHAQRGDFSEAMADLKKAIDLDPARREKAAGIIEQIKAIEAAGDNLNGPALLMACKSWRDPTRQLKACDRLVATMKSPPKDHAAALTLRGSMAVMAGQDETGMRDLDEALRLSPSEPAIRISKANALWMVGRYAEAKTLTDALVATGQDRRQWTRQLAVYAYIQGEMGEAIRILDSDSAPPLGTINRFYAGMLRAEQNKGDKPGYFDIQTPVGDGAFAAASVAYRRGEASEAELLAAADAFPKNAKARAACQAHFSIGQKAAIEGQKQKALAAFKQSLSTCERGTFEQHLGTAWVKRLSAT